MTPVHPIFLTASNVTAIVVTARDTHHRLLMTMDLVSSHTQHIPKAPPAR
jgi:hypothetical protein